MGTGEPKPIIPNCDPRFNHMNQVQSKTDLGYALITVATLGIVMPQRVKWCCAPYSPPTDSINQCDHNPAYTNRYELSPIIKHCFMPPLNLPDGIEIFPITKWENGHQNFTHQFKKKASFKLRIPFLPATKEAQYHQTTSNFQWLIRHAIDNNLELRAVGNGWSFNDIMVCDGGMIDTKLCACLSGYLINLSMPTYLATGKGPGDLFLVECGMSILDIHEKLELLGESQKIVESIRRQ